MARPERNCYRQVVPFVATLMVEFVYVGENTLFKAAKMKGMMSNYVFILYTCTLSAFVLIPLAFVFHRKSSLPPFDAPVFARICFLGILGLSSRILGYKGVEYSSPTLASALGNLTAAFTFILAVFLRMEKLSLRSSTTKVKIIGTLILISGAFVVTLYKGPPLKTTPSSTSSLDHQTLRSSQSGWAIGGLLLVAQDIVIAMWIVIQAQTVKMYPAEFVLVSVYSLCMAILSLPVCLIFEPNLSNWRVSTNSALIAIIFTGLIRTALCNVIHLWSMKLKGPVFVALFSPLSIVIAAAAGFIFLGETLHLGSVIGAIILSSGFYTVIWGKAKEEMVEEFEVVSVESASTQNVPLLQ